MKPNDSQWSERMRAKYAPEIDKAREYNHDAAREDADFEREAMLSEEHLMPKSWTEK